MTAGPSGQASTPSVDREMSDLGKVRRMGFGLALKFTVPVTLALSLAIVLMGFVVYGSARETMERELNRSGVIAAKLAAAPGLDAWNEEFNTLAELYERLGRLEEALGLPGHTKPVEMSEEQRAKIRGHDSRVRSHNRRRLRTLNEARGLLDVWIVAYQGSGKGTRQEALQASASGRSAAALSYRETPEGFTLASSPRARITRGYYPGEEERVPCRFFRYPITGPDGEETGYANVVFSEVGMRRGLQELKGSIVLFCSLAIVICGVVAYATSKLHTRPLKALLDDIRAVAGGDLSHRTRARSRDEIGVLARAFDGMTRNLAEAERMRMDLADKKHQLTIAQEVQERLFPAELPAAPGFRLDAANRLAGQLSSDLFDTLTLEDGRVGCLVTSASGRGFPAAIVLSMARSIFRATAARRPSPAEALRHLNAILAPDLRRGMYVSAVYAVIDPATGSGQLASAGHAVPGLHYVASAQGLRKVASDGIALGLDRGPVFDRSLTETAFQLEAGDRLVLATEGMLHLHPPSGDSIDETEYMRRVLRPLKEGGGSEEVLASVTWNLEPGDEHPDLTLVVAAKD